MRLHILNQDLVFVALPFLRTEFIGTSLCLRWRHAISKKIFCSMFVFMPATVVVKKLMCSWLVVASIALFLRKSRL